MQPDRMDAIEDRLRHLERKVEMIDYRVRSIEQARTGTQVVMPPPVQVPAVVPGRHTEPSAPPSPPSGWQQEVPQPPPYVRPPQPARSARDTEYIIGAQLLPKLGAGLVLLGVLFFVAWGYSAGWITPWMVFSGEILFCLAFLGVGQWKRNEREQYGQILTGIGSCGLYLSLAGGHLVQNLFSGEVLVGAFMALSFANLLYGFWSTSRAFLAIGIIGGLAAALLPMKEQKTTLNAILHLAIVLPAALIAAKRKWSDMAAWLWLFGTLAALPLLTSSIDWQTRLTVLYLSSLMSVAAYAYRYEKNLFDPEAIFGPVMLFVTALIGLAVEHDRIGAVHLLLLGGGAALVSIGAPSGSLCRQRLLFTAIAIPATIAPFCFSPTECIGIFLGLTMIAALGAAVARVRLAAVFAAVEFVLALSSYLAVQGWNELPLANEAWLLGGLIVAGAAAAFGAVRSGGGAELFTIGAMALILPMFARLGVITLTGSGMSTTSEMSAAEALAFFAMAAIALTARTRWISAMVAMWTSFGIAVAAYMYAAAFGGVPSLHDATLVVVLAIAAAAGTPVATGTAPPDFRKSISGVAGVLVGFLAMRLAYVLATMPGAHANALVSIVLTAAGYSIVASLVSLVRRSEPALSVAWLMFAAAGTTYLTSSFDELRRAHEMAIMSGLFAAFLAAFAAVRGMAQRHVEIWHPVAFVGWVVFSRFVDVSLSWSGFDLHGASTMTVAWIVYALLLLSIGILIEARELRYWSFGVMMVTVCKILLQDLASTSIPFRVAVLLGLGLLMLGGGYWYIKGRSRLQGQP